MQSASNDLFGIAFEEISATRGIDFQWAKSPRPLRILEAFGAGCAFLDYDGDGWQDILLVGNKKIALFRNQQDGSFKDVSAETRLALSKGDWRGCAVGDYNGDGYLDLLITGYQCLALLENQSGRKWKDVTVLSGLDTRNKGHWGSSAGFMDLDGNGTLDLVLGNYVAFGPKEKQYCTLIKGVESGCPPRFYRPEFPELWQNLGNGKFKEKTANAGLKNVHGKVLVLAFADVNSDGQMDFYIGNDGLPAELMINQGGLRFRNAGVQSGVAFSMTPGRAIAAMGADFGDYNGDGKWDLVVSAFSDEPFSLLQNTGNGLFEHKADVTGIAGATLKPLGFGTKWVDVDNDGWQDILFANGHVYDKSELIDPLSPFLQPLMLFHNQQGHQFLDIASKVGGNFTKPIIGRGSATGDFDNDGRVDLLVVDYEGPPLLLHNVSQTKSHWIKLDLRGRGKNHFAHGAQVVARAGKRIWIGCVSPASSYLSSSDPRIHFGLGSVSKVDNISIRWPSGRKETLREVTANKIIKVREGEGVVEN